MASKFRAVRLPEALAQRLEERCRATGKTRSQIMVESLETELADPSSAPPWVRREIEEALAHLQRALAAMADGEDR